MQSCNQNVLGLGKGGYRRGLWLAIAAACLAGCATQTAGWTWGKPGASEQDYYTDSGQCRAQAFATAGVTLMQAAVVNHACMQGKGWREVPN